MQRTPTCPNCCKSYGFKDVSKPIGNRIPLLLECGHTFCEGCITKLARVQKTQVSCPECTYNTPLKMEGEKGVKGIPANIHLLGVITNTKRASFRSDVQKTGRSKLGTKAGLQRAINQFAQEKKAETAKNDTGVKCEECCRGIATSLCNKCETVYCSACFERVHSYSNALRKHTPLPVKQTSSDTAVGCPEHNNRPLEFFDKDTGQPVCSHCVVMGERQTHAIVPVDDIAQEVQAQFKASIDQVTTIVTHLDKSVKKICGVLPEVKSEKNSIINDIREHFQSLYAALQTREHSLIKDVELNHSGEQLLEKLREDVTENLRKAKNYIQELETLIGQPQKLIDSAKKLKSELETFQDMPCFAVAISADKDEAQFVPGKELCNNISEYGSVSMDGQPRLELKKISDLTEDDLREDNTGEVVAEAQEDQLEEAGNALPSVDNEQHTGTPRTITASKILKANLAYRLEMVLVTHIKDPCEFMIQRVADMEQLQLMMNIINIYCDSTENVHDLLYDVKFGDMCCAQFTTDNQWYRACIKTAYSPACPNVVPTLENGLCVEVQYIDYGNSEWLPLSRLRKMKSEFLNIPELAQCCSLADIVPPFQEEKWPPKATKAFGSLTGDKPLFMTVIEKKGSKLIVDLRRPEDDEPTQDDDRPVSVRDALVFLEVARFTSPASRPEGLFFPKKTYKDPVPIGEGAFVDVLVTHVVSPDEFYVQKLRSEETVELQHIMEEISKMFSGRRRGTEWSVPWPYKGLVCAARFTEDKIWYRALVTAVNSDETVNVTYVDFGNSEKLPFSEIRKLPDMFLRLPKQALPICLVDIKPSGAESKWQKQDQDNLTTLILNKSLVVDVKGLVDDKMSVLLYDTSGSQDVCINEFLVLNGFCQSAGLGIIKSREELAAEKENTEERTSETNSQEGSVTAGSENQGDQVSQCSSYTKEEKAVPEEKTVVKEDSVVPAASPVVLEEFQYKPAPVPEKNRFQAGVTFVDSQGYIYAQEVKEGDRTLINIMSSLLGRYGKGDETSTSPSNVTLLPPGFPCVAQFTEDGMWYRGRVVKYVGEDKVEVNYVDFGNSEVVPLSAIRQEMPFMEIPQQCLQLVLRGIEPKTSDGHWPADIIRELSQEIVGQDCIAVIKGDKLPGYPLVVRLFLSDDTDVAQTLLSRGLVQKSILLHDEESSQFYPQKRGPNKAKPVKSKRSITETRAHAQMIGSREAECMLARTDLPLDDIRYDVTITHIERPDCLYIQRVPPTDKDPGFSDDPDPTLEASAEELQTLEEIMAKINEPDYFKKYTPLTTASEGMLCCARYSEDDLWYRAQVKSVERKNPLEVRVVYVDYGTTEVVNADRLRGFPSDLLELPTQSTRCFLADIRPPDTTEGPMTEDGCWPVNTMEALIQIVTGKKLVAKTMFSGPPASVILYEHKTRSDGCIEQVSVGYLLAQKGLAKCADYAEYVRIEESDNDDPENCESDGNVLEFQESELSFKSAASEARTESKSSSSADLLEKIFDSKVGFASSSPPKTPLLTPSALSVKSEQQSSKKEEISTELSSSVKNKESESSRQITRDQARDETRDQEHSCSEPVVVEQATEVRAAVAGSNVTEVNQDSVESSV